MAAGRLGVRGSSLNFLLCFTVNVVLMKRLLKIIDRYEQNNPKVLFRYWSVAKGSESDAFSFCLQGRVTTLEKR